MRPIKKKRYRVQFFGIDTYHDLPSPKGKEYPFKKLTEATSYLEFWKNQIWRSKMRVVDQDGNVLLERGVIK